CRRRHTRSKRDWSSDVCSSDLPPPAQGAPVRPGQLGADMRPLDKDGDGKMDPDAVPATKEALLDENGDPKEVDTAVIVDGEEHRSEERRVGKECRARRSGHNAK